MIAFYWNMYSTVFCEGGPRRSPAKSCDVVIVVMEQLSLPCSDAKIRIPLIISNQLAGE